LWFSQGILRFPRNLLLGQQFIPNVDAAAIGGIALEA
jgi:hypothetical protein